MADSDRRRRAEEIFQRALELPDEERPAFLAKAADDEALRREVESLLRHQDEMGSFLASPVVGPGSTEKIDHAGPSDDRFIGPYRLLRVLGHGGMGEVWLAEQREPIRRRVALKIIRPGMGSEEVVRRFESERQALALMEHPCVAKVLDAGATDQGSPYFVMEYVDGVAITEFADRHRLTVRQRLQLFQRVCEGVQHAHQKAIIHRDLKPSNILVVEIDGEFVPKIIDFGVAKALAQKLTDETMYTELGVLIGTPEYMSPEQADLGGDRVDTRTDVYALGVVLYDLLVGALPFDSASLRSAGLEKICQILRTEVPSRPSARLRELEDRSEELARARRVDVAGFRRLISGDLDWIAMKALEKEPERRYGSPQELAADIQRHLDDRPVLAGPPSAAYRARKYLKRHAVGVTFASVVLLLLIGGIAGTSLGLLRARQESRTSALVAASMEEMLRGAAPSVALGRDTQMLEEMMERSVETWSRELTDAPEVEAQLLATVSEVYAELGQFDQAAEQGGRALELWRDLHGPRHPQVAHALNLVGAAEREAGRLEAAREHIEAGLEIRRELLGDHPDVAASLGDLGKLLYDAGDFQGAEQAHRQALEIRRRLLGDEHPATVASLNALSLTLAELARYDEAEEMQRSAVAIQRRLVESPHPDLASNLDNLASVLDRREKYDEALPLFREVLEMRRQLLGEEHPDVALSYSLLGGILGRMHRHDEAVEMHRRALDLRLELFGEMHPQTAMSLNNLATVYDRQERFDEALELYRRSLAVRRQVQGEDHPYVAITLNNIAFVQMAQGDWAGAEPVLAEAVERYAAVVGPDHPNVAGIRSNHGRTLFELGRYEEAVEQLALAHEKAVASVGADHIIAAKAQAFLGASLARLGRAVEAEKHLTESFGILEEMRGADSRYAQVAVREMVALCERRMAADPALELSAELERWRGRLADGSG